jgi:hypothetical protein
MYFCICCILCNQVVHSQRPRSLDNRSRRNTAGFTTAVELEKADSFYRNSTQFHDIELTNVKIEKPLGEGHYSLGIGGALL